MWLEAERGGAGVRRGACREMARGSPDTQAKITVRVKKLSSLYYVNCIFLFIVSCPSVKFPTIFYLCRDQAPAQVAAPVVEAPTPVLGEPMDLMTALQLVMKKSSAHDGLVKGLREVAKAIEKHVAQLCVLAEDCDQPDYVKLVKALCAEHNVHLVTVPSAKTLGEWAGLCKIDSEGKARKVVGCSCVVVKDYGEESEGLNIVQEYVKSH
ncbi:hypothetical protein ACQ4PT_051859 [Festuca glaucescens]